MRRSVPGVPLRGRAAWPASSSERQRWTSRGPRAVGSAPRHGASACTVRQAPVGRRPRARPTPGAPTPGAECGGGKPWSSRPRTRTPVWLRFPAERVTPASSAALAGAGTGLHRVPQAAAAASKRTAAWAGASARGDPFQPPSRRRGPGAPAGRTGLRLPRDWPVEVPVHASTRSLAGKAPAARPLPRPDVGRTPAGSGGVAGSCRGLSHVRGGRGGTADAGRGRARWRTGLVVSAGSQPYGGAAARPRAPAAGAGRGALASREPLFSPGERAADARVAGPGGLRGWASAERFVGRQRPFLCGAPAATRGAGPRWGPGRRGGGSDPLRVRNWDSPGLARVPCRVSARAVLRVPRRMWGAEARRPQRTSAGSWVSRSSPSGCSPSVARRLLRTRRSGRPCRAPSAASPGPEFVVFRRAGPLYPGAVCGRSGQVLSQSPKVLVGLKPLGHLPVAAWPCSQAVCSHGRCPLLTRACPLRSLRPTLAEGWSCVTAGGGGSPLRLLACRIELE